MRARGKNINIKEPPALASGSIFIWGSFWELLSEKQHEEGQIPWFAIRRFAKEYDMHNQEFDSFLYLVRSLENEYRSLRRDQITTDREMRKARQSKPNRKR